jgi:hypothetical protein
MGLCVSVYKSFNCNPSFVSLCMWNCSSEGPLMNTLEQIHIHRLTKDGLQLNDTDPEASTIGELLERKSTAPVKKSENTVVGIRHADHVALSIRKSWH